MGNLLQDLRYGARLLVRSPGFAAAAVLVLALGIGANTAIFSVVYAILLRPLPFPEPDRLVRVWHVPPAAAFPGMTRFSVSAGNYLDWKAQNRSFENIAVVGFSSLSLTGAGDPASVTAARVSPDFFSVLRTQPVLGRTFAAEEDAPGAGHVVVLTHAFWKNRLGGDAGIVGRDLRFDGQPYRVVGVMGPEATLPEYSSVWVPMAWTAEEKAVRSEHSLSTIARLKPGVGLAAAQADMDLISARLQRDYPQENADWGAVVVPLHEDDVADVRPVLLVLLGAVSFVLLIACANVTNLTLARTVLRQKEIAIRTALGANRARVLRQIVSESIVLSLAGGAVGLLLGAAGVRGLEMMLADELPPSMTFPLSLPVLAFTLGISLLTGVLAGLAPAWRGTGTNVVDGLKRGLGRTDADGGNHRTRSLLVVSEVALSLVLLIGAGLLIRTLVHLRSLDPGFEASNVTTFAVSLPESRYPEAAQRAAFVERLTERLQALPGVEKVGAAGFLPLRGAQSWPIQVEGRDPLPVSQQPNVFTMQVGGDFFDALRMKLVRGRLLARSDTAESPGVIVISESMAKQFWPGEDAIGKRLVAAFVPEKPREVVGIVRDVRYRGLAESAPVAAMYLPLAQTPRPYVSFAIRSGAPVALAAVAAVHAMDPELPVSDVASLDDIVSMSLGRQRLGVTLLGSFAALALVLAAVGIYSVLSYSVRNRSREIGIRMALGAERTDVLRLIVGQGLRPAFAGMAIGLAAALALGRAVSSLLYGVTPTDPVTMAVVAALLGTVAMVACLLPALRATRVDPMRVLRDE